MIIIRHYIHCFIFPCECYALLDCPWRIELQISFGARSNNKAYMLTQGTIRDAVEDSITWPVRKVIPILPGDYRYDCGN